MRKIHIPLRNQAQRGKANQRRACCINTREALLSSENSGILIQGSVFALFFCSTLLFLQYSVADVFTFWSAMFWRSDNLGNTPEPWSTSSSSISGSSSSSRIISSGANKKSIINNIIDIDAGHQVDCISPGWCSVPIPRKSLFGFSPPTDVEKWRKARSAAARGDHTLLREINKVVTSPFDLLDGDPFFRRYHYLTDVFVDEERWLAPLTQSEKQHFAPAPPGSSSGVKGVKTGAYQRIPSPYNFSTVGRAAVVQVGYSVLNKNNNAFFTGDHKGIVKIDRKLFLQEWRQVKDDISTKYIVVVLTDPDWGWLSSYIKGRTANLGLCCSEAGDDHLLEFLNDDNLLLLVVNQHSNIAHPKVLSIPRGIPSRWEHGERVVFDAIRVLLGGRPKERLLIAPASSWKDRVAILENIAKNILAEDFEVFDLKQLWSKSKSKPLGGSRLGVPGVERLNRLDYYLKLGSSRFGLALPGIGCDTYRTWELLTMGTVVIAEKTTGLDRTFWRLPVLLVDSFEEVTTELLRTAYVEAIYRASEFEFERLTQNFWWSLISNVSVASNAAIIAEKFPLY